MNTAISIRPSKDLRTNYASLSELSRQNPVAITVNGREDTVLVSHEEYMRQQREKEELKARVALYQHLAQSQDDIKLGRTEPAEDVFAELKAELTDMKL